MQTLNFPTFEINQLGNTEKGLELIGVISSDTWGGQKWVDDKWIGSLRVADSVVFGRWHRRGAHWGFAVDREDNPIVEFFKGQEVELIDGYWGERVGLVINGSIVWERVKFKETTK